MPRRLLFGLASFLLLVLSTVSVARAGEVGRYIVVLTPGSSATDVAAQHARSYGAQVTHVYTHALQGYAAKMAPEAAERVAQDPHVAYVEADQPVKLSQDIPTGISRTFAASNTGIDIDTTDDYRVDVDVAIIDTGIDYTHPDLNVVSRADCTGGGPFGGSCVEGSGDDGNGHGTHVAGTVGALDNGIGVVGMAPGARLWAVKVLGNNGSGWLSWVVAGIDHVTAHAGQIEVANMSLGCECSSGAMDTAISNSVSAGVVYAVAAGNSDKDVSTFSPANHPDVISVSALADFDGTQGGTGSPTCRTDQDDTLADFSNWGPGIEVTAPGVCILSTWKGATYDTISGTSMASPHVAGAAALLASVNNPSNRVDVLTIRETIIDNGNFNWTDDSGDGIQEPLLDVSYTAVFAPVLVPVGGGNIAPTASFTYSCSDLSCSFDGSGSSDADGTVVDYSWDFGDDGTGTGAQVSHDYAPAGTYSVTLTVTDDGGAVDTDVKQVPVDLWNLSAIKHRIKGIKYVDLTWSSGATLASSVNVFRNGSVVTTTDNDGAYTDGTGGSLGRGGGTYTYKVCAAGSTSDCSLEVTVIF